MAREVIISTWCDCCLDDTDTRESADQYAITVNGAEYELDLCHSCREVLEREFLSTAQKAEQPEASIPCPGRGCGKTYPSRTRVAEHYKRIHGEALAAYEHRIGQTILGQAFRATCLRCEQSWVNMIGAAQHRRASGHEIKEI